MMGRALTALVLVALLGLVVAGAGCADDAESTTPTASIVFLDPARADADTTLPSSDGTETADAASEETTASVARTVEIEPIEGQAGDAKTVKLLGVGFGAEGAMITVQFKVTDPKIAGQWRQGNVYVIDEANQALYAEIPVTPVIGPLFGRPVLPDQVGYVMFKNQPPYLYHGAKVTVVLGGFKQRHVEVQ